MAERLHVELAIENGHTTWNQIMYFVDGQPKQIKTYPFLREGILLKLKIIHWT